MRRNLILLIQKKELKGKHKDRDDKDIDNDGDVDDKAMSICTIEEKQSLKQ